jgi:solute carrier family 38 (sodium-coupled neutral amino acid transporter), member 9
MLLLKDITKLIKIAHYGVVAIVAYGVFVIYIFIENMANGTVLDYSDDIVLFSWNFSKPAG